MDMDGVGLGEEAVPGVAAGVGYGVVGFEDAVGQPSLAGRYCQMFSTGFKFGETGTAAEGS